MRSACTEHSRQIPFLSTLVYKALSNAVNKHNHGHEWGVNQKLKKGVFSHQECGNAHWGLEADWKQDIPDIAPARL